MKARYKAVAAAITAIQLIASSVHAGNFVNLDFESTTISAPVDASESVDAGVLFPGWTVRYGTEVQSTAKLNILTLDYFNVTLMCAVAPSPLVIEGTHSAYLSSGLYDPGVSLSQTGTIPTGTRSFRFLARNLDYPHNTQFPGAFDIQINGVSLPSMTLSASAGDRVIGVDVSAFAGQTVDLHFGLIAFGTTLPHVLEGSALVDALSFSPEPLPEPATFYAAALGLLALRRRRP